LNSRGPSDAGETLIEILIAIAVMGIAFAALLGGMLTAATMSGVHRLQADGHLQLVHAIETVKAAPYVPCTKSYLVSDVPTDWAVTDTVEYWDGTNFGATCLEPPDGPVPYYRTQRITFVVASSDGRVSRTETVLKRG
jgi:type II secretory pathway pseudopilin PulG